MIRDLVWGKRRNKALSDCLYAFLQSWVTVHFINAGDTPYICLYNDMLVQLMWTHFDMLDFNGSKNSCTSYNIIETRNYWEMSLMTNVGQCLQHSKLMLDLIASNYVKQNVKYWQIKFCIMSKLSWQVFEWIKLRSCDKNNLISYTHSLHYV